MNIQTSREFTSSIHYLERQPEMLVLEGYRHWIAGFDTGSVIPWEMVSVIYAKVLGLKKAKYAIAELSHFIRTLHFCAACPLKSFPYGALHICREEYLLVVLVSALQNHDDATRDLCLEYLVGECRACDLLQAAKDYAQVMEEYDQMLLPVPHFTITQILSSSGQQFFH